MIHSDSIKKLLKQHSNEIEILTYDSVTSTNDIAKEYAINNPTKEVAIIASKQTAGRGRRGRSFFSPDGTGLYLSVLLRPDIEPQSISLLTPFTALCVANAIESVSNEIPKIKWINDIYINNKKASGILCEAALSPEGNKPDYVIVGIGVNLSTPTEGFPDEIKEIATSVFGDKMPDAKTVESLCATVIGQLLNYKKEIDSRLFIDDYKNKLFMLGHEVNVITPNETYLATAIDIDSDAHLIVLLPDGTKKTLDAGEISIKTY